MKRKRKPTEGIPLHTDTAFHFPPQQCVTCNTGVLNLL
uniref:Uncharacterized protein n=1 Tax=Anguilla anguilla TaxID=7936 RepID=A0A0E9SV36_ANGAN